MVATIRQTLTVRSEGTLEVHSDEFRPGDKAEVIVVVSRGEESRLSPLEAFRKLQESLNLTPEAAAAWKEMVRQERESFGPRQ